MRIRVWTVVLLLCLLPPYAGAQQTCGDLDLDGDVDSIDALILRQELDASVPLTAEQAVACDVISEARAPGLEPDPDNAAGRCSMSDAAVMSRRELALLPGPAPVCALASTADCCSAHAAIGCNSPGTVACVCNEDPTCCTVDWDATCAALACTTACAPICTPPADAYCAGECRDYAVDMAHCGSCNALCALPNASESCVDGLCSLGACDTGTCNLDGSTQTGCESVLNDNPTCPGFLGPAIAGDADGPPFIGSGVGETIQRIQLTEQVGFSSIPLTARIRLDSPAGTNYDLFVQCPTCSAVPRTSITDVIEVGHSDGPGDSLTEVIVEVRLVSGTSCAPWTLTVTGHVATTDRSCDQ